MKFSKEELKAEAKRLRFHFGIKHNLRLSVGQSLEAIAAIKNFPNWDACAGVANAGSLQEESAAQKELQIFVPQNASTEAVYGAVCRLMRRDPDHIVFVVSESDQRSSSEWEKITDVIGQCELGYSRHYVDARSLPQDLRVS